MEKKRIDKKIKIKAHYSGGNIVGGNDIEKMAGELRSETKYFMSSKDCVLFDSDKETGKLYFTEKELEGVSKFLGTTIEKLDPLASDSYWDDKPLIIDSMGVLLDLNTRTGFKDYLIAASSPATICKKEDLGNIPSAKFVMMSPDDDRKTASNKQKLAYRAMVIIEKYSKQPQKLRDILSLYFHKYKTSAIVGPNTPIEQIKDDLIILSSEEPEKFIEIAGNDNFENEIALVTAIEAKAVIERNGRFYLAFDDGVPFAVNWTEAVDFLSDPANGKAKKAILDEIKAKGK